MCCDSQQLELDPPGSLKTFKKIHPPQLIRIQFLQLLSLATEKKPDEDIMVQPDTPQSLRKDIVYTNIHFT